MGYVEKTLMRGENIAHTTRLHWIIFLWSVIWFIIGYNLLGKGSTTSGSEGTTIVGTTLIMFSFVLFLEKLINYFTSEFGITNKRLIFKVGFIKRTTVELLLSKVESLEVKQGVLGRILNFGTIVVGGTGGTKNSFKKIWAPIYFRQKAQTQISLTQETTPQVIISTPKESQKETSSTISDKLKELKELFNQDIISEEEFNSKKKELLTQL